MSSLISCLGDQEPCSTRRFRTRTITQLVQTISTIVKGSPPIWSTLYLHGVTLGFSLIYLCFNGRTSMSKYLLNSGGVVQSPFPKQTEQHAPGPYQLAEALVGRNVTPSLYQSKADRKVSKSFYNHLRYTRLIRIQSDRAAKYRYTGLQPFDSE